MFIALIGERLNAHDFVASAIENGATHYCSSPGLPSFRETAARNYQREFGVDIGPENVVVAPGAKVCEQFFCEAFLDPGDAVLVLEAMKMEMWLK